MHVCVDMIRFVGAPFALIHSETINETSFTSAIFGPIFFSLFVFVPFHFAIMHVTKSPSITSRLNLCDVFKSSYSFLQWNDSAVRNGRHKRTQDFSFLLFFIWTLCMMYFSYFFPRLYIFSEHLHPRQSVFEKSNITNLLEMPTIFDVQPLKLDVLTSGGTFSSVDRIILWP